MSLFNLISKAVTLGILFCVNLAWSHPTDNDDIWQIGIGSYFQVTKNINIIPMLPFYEFEYKNSYNETERVCYLRTQAKLYDRFLKKGTKLYITKATASYLHSDNERSVSLEINGGFDESDTDKVFEVQCIHDMNIGQLKELLQSHLKLVLATPKEMH